MHTPTDQADFKSKSGRLTGLFWFCLTALAVTPVLTDWLKNIYQVGGQDLIIPLLLNSLTAVIVTLIFNRLLHKNKIAAFVAGILTILLLTNGYEGRFLTFYPFLHALNPLTGFEDHQLLSLIFIGLLMSLSAGVAVLFSKVAVRRTWSSQRIITALTIVICVTFAFQLFPALRAVIIEWPQFSYRPPQLTSQATSATTKPDIYYIVLDRYASQSVLKSQFNFDNADFINYLTKNNFYTNPDAHNSYPYTTMSIASTLNANYETDLIQKFAGAALQTLEPYHLAIRYASVIQKLKTLGYSYYHLGTWYEASNQAPLADRYYQKDGQLTILNHQITLDNFSKNELAASPYWHFVEAGVKIGSFRALAYSHQDWDKMSLDQLNNLQAIAQQPANGKFIFAHILVPHDPYYFNADGSFSATANSDNVGQPIKQKYVGQVKFINEQMKKLIDQINKTSNGQAIILLQADEGPYPMQLNDEDFDLTKISGEIADGNMLDWSDANLQMKLGPLAAYHIPQASSPALAQGADLVNVFRLVLNTYFGDNQPYLPRCYYAYPNGRAKPFVYTDVTERLTGQPAPACPKDSNFSS